MCIIPRHLCHRISHASAVLLCLAVSTTCVNFGCRDRRRANNHTQRHAQHHTTRRNTTQHSKEALEAQRALRALLGFEWLGFCFCFAFAASGLRTARTRLLRPAGLKPTPEFFHHQTTMSGIYIYIYRYVYKDIHM